MSFAAETKEALCALFIKNECCELSLLWGLLRYGGDFSEERIRLCTNSAPVTALCRALLSKHFGIEVPSGGHLTLSARDAALIYHAYHADEGARAFSAWLRCEHCTGAFLRGVFLAAGNLSDPGNSYHLDFLMQDAESAQALGAFLQSLDMPARSTVRGAQPLLYYKGSEAIEDFLVTIGARRAAFTVMDEKIRKDIRNNTNRVINLEVANLSKTASNAARQLRAIALLQKSGKLSHLEEALQITARLRQEHPDATLSALAALHDPPLTKSGLNHRLARLTAAAKEEKERP